MGTKGTKIVTEVRITNLFIRKIKFVELNLKN